MRKEAMVAWRSRAWLAIAVGLVGGLVLGIYAVFQLGVNGLASSGCGGGGCEDRLSADAAHYECLLYIALFVGGGLVVTGITAAVTLGKRIARLSPPSLPVASVVKDHDSGWKI
jgi:hypothetical protein